VKRLIALLLNCLTAMSMSGCGTSDSQAIDVDSGSTNIADIPKHIEAFKDKSHEGLVQARAMYALVKIGSPAVPPLTSALQSENVSVRLMALNTLNLIGPGAKSAIPAITKLQKDQDLDVQKRAKDVLAKLSSS